MVDNEYECAISSVTEVLKSARGLILMDGSQE